MFRHIQLFLIILVSTALTDFSLELTDAESILDNNYDSMVVTMSLFSITPLELALAQEPILDLQTLSPVQNNPPIATGGSVETQSQQPVSISLTASDPDSTDILQYQINSNPVHGVLSGLQGNVIIYTPNPEFSGNDAFSFSVSDGKSHSNQAIISITVNPTSPDQTPNEQDNTYPDIPQQPESGTTETQEPLSPDQSLLFGKNVAIRCDHTHVEMTINDRDSINCIIQNNNNISVDVKVTCHGLSGTGIECKVEPFTPQLRVNSMSDTNFSVILSTIDNETPEPGLYPFTIRYETIFVQ